MTDWIDTHCHLDATEFHADLGAVVRAWQPVTQDVAYTKVAFELITPKLLQEGVYRSKMAMAESLEKTGAARQVNLQHELVKAFENFQHAMWKQAAVTQEHNEVGQALNQYNAFLAGFYSMDPSERAQKLASVSTQALQQAAHAAPAAEKGLWRAAKDMSSDAGKSLGEGAHGLTKLITGSSSNAPASVQRAVEGIAAHAPELALLAGASTLDDKITGGQGKASLKNAVNPFATPMNPYGYLVEDSHDQPTRYVLHRQACGKDPGCDQEDS